ncbi:MAG: hypothetical protein CL947_00585 [Epsilonproteobacteria bacterium]|nr:hypothetical protein [Campylobacterota bacterium]|tara:strand:- start:4211 stop:4879 length:669 start_codon:yes stop_codon:yes gene_type:complete
MKNNTAFFIVALCSLSLVILHTMRTSTQDTFTLKEICSDNTTLLDSFFDTDCKNFTLSTQEIKFLYGYTPQLLKKHIKIQTKKNLYRYYILSYMHNDNCIGFIVLKININRQDNTTEYFYLLNNPETKIYDYALIEYLAVDAHYRKQGIAQKLIKQALKKCLDINLDSLALTVDNQNTLAINLYKKAGFQLINPQEKQLVVNHQPTQQKITNGYFLMFEKTT